ncbi:MAG: aminomethyl-transferring glycine dehydrogenase subunit GcvPB, partial [Vulcanimicrobiota bacterium]
MYDKLIFEISKEGRPPYSLNERGGICEVPGRDAAQLIPGEFLADEEVELPMVGELDLVRHYTHLSRKNYGVDTHFYPLGSCTMKYNPKVNERVSRFRGFTEIHPYADENLVQGALEVLYYTDYYLSRITGMSGFTLQPAAGAHGELTGILLVKAYFDDIGEAGISRKKILIPDSAHGTNPASAVLGGFEVEEIKSDSRGNVDLAHLKEKLDNTVACVMLTMPNTLGLFDENMLEISRLVHEAGALLYMDGANLNAIMGICRPAELGFDIMHINLHKTFSAPHGGGGPGSGPVGVVEKLLPFLPGPRVEKNEKTFSFFKPEKTIGRVRAFYGNFNVIVKALAYMTGLGADGIKES